MEHLPNRPLLEISEVIPLFNVKEDTFRKWIKRKLLPENLIQKIGNTLRVRKNILISYLEGNLEQ